MPNSPSEHFHLSSFTKESFFQALSNSHCSPAVVSTQRQAQYLFDYLTELQTKTIIVELKYVDGDYLDDYASYYVRCFQQYERFCKRIHFVSETYNPLNFLETLGKKNSDPAFQKLSKNYLGFVVARPLPESVVGRTILKTYPSDNGRRAYPGIRKYYPNLFGIKMELESLAFQQQDTVLAACATVALWSCYHKTTELFGTPCPRPADITKVANQVVVGSRPFPSRGLRIEQICNSIRKLDLEPEVISITGDVPLVSLVYGYMRMGLPVLLVVYVEDVGLHALTLAGYSLNNENYISSEVFGGESIPMVGLRIDKFYAHDDQIGPFSRISVKPGIPNPKQSPQQSYPVIFQGSWKDHTSGKLLSIFPTAVIVPVYNKIRLRFSDIKIPIERLNSLLNSFRKIIGETKKEEWDIHLITTNSYKEEVKNLNHHGDSKNILLAPHPKYIWRTIYKLNGKTVLELLADATDIKLVCPFYKMTIIDPEMISILKNVFNPTTSQPGFIPALISILTEPFYNFLKDQINSSCP